MEIDQFFFFHVQQTYGLDQLAHKYCEIYLASIDEYKKKDIRIELFRRFIGLDNDRLPYSIFDCYVQMLKATGIPVPTIY